jgi:predicted lipoprotein with Yx(FWY)xxD motif
MKRMILSLAVVAATALLAACGSSSSPSPSSSSGTGSGSSGSGLSVQKVNGVGSVLVDSHGMALYASRQEAGGHVLCSGGCLSFWIPAKPVAGKAPNGVATLGTVKRPDGSAQLTAGGTPLYTFSQDAPGKVAGNGISDHFGSQSFTWHALTVGGAAKQPAAQAPAAPSSGGGYGGY